MAITPHAREIQLTAVNEGYTLPFPKKIVGINFQGTGLTASQRLQITDSATPGSGNTLADYLTEGTADNGDLWGGRQPQIISAISIANNTVAGTWVVTVAVID